MELSLIKGLGQYINVVKCLMILIATFLSLYRLKKIKYLSDTDHAMLYYSTENFQRMYSIYNYRTRLFPTTVFFF